MGRAFGFDGLYEALLKVLLRVIMALTTEDRRAGAKLKDAQPGLAEIKARKLAGELVAAETVKEQWLGVMLALRAALLDLRLIGQEGVDQTTANR